jgi:hypothetical protein
MGSQVKLQPGAFGLMEVGKVSFEISTLIGLKWAITLIV